MRTSPPKVGFIPATTCLLLAGCGSLDSPEVPFTGTSSISTPSGTASPGGSGSPSPTGARANGLTAPTIVGPLPGETFSDPQPTLTVRNASSEDGTPIRYDFEVATDDGFRGIVAQVQGVAEGGSGTTSWRVASPLGDARYYWRARGTGARGEGPFSPISDFSIGSGPVAAPAPAPPTGGGVVVDPLTNGTSAGQVVGGRFTASGWQVRSRGDFIRYVVPSIQSGFVEWENLGLSRFNPQPDLYTLFGMWDPSKGPYRENPYRVHVRKLDEQGHNPPWLRLRFISGGDQRDVGYDFLDWIPNRVYRWRVEWGPGGSGNEARVLLDGRVVIRTGYGPAYRPEEHWIEMGVEERAESIVGVTYRNVRIGRR